MSFNEHLKGITDRLEGILGIAIVDMDGIIVEEYSVNPRLDMTTLAAEYTPFWNAADKAGSSVDFPPPEEMNLLHDTTAVIAKKINSEYFLLLGLESERNIGKGRFFAKMAAAAIGEEL